MRDSDTFDLASLGTLTNFDPSQLPTGIPFDGKGDEDEGGPEDDEDEDANRGQTPMERKIEARPRPQCRGHRSIWDPSEMMAE